MEVDVQVEGSAEALDVSDGAGVASGEAEGGGAAAEIGAELRGEDPQQLPEEGAIEGDAEPELEGQREHPLTSAPLRPDPIDEARGGLGHAAPGARRTEPAPLAGEGDDAACAAGGAAHPAAAVLGDAAGASGGLEVGERGVKLVSEGLIEERALGRPAGVAGRRVAAGGRAIGHVGSTGNRRARRQRER